MKILLLFTVTYLRYCVTIEFEKFLPIFGPDFKTINSHLKPYGWQRKPEGPAKEYNVALPASEFHENHVKHARPLVYRNAIRNSLGISKWSDDYLKQSYGHLDVLVELKSEDRDYSTGRMKFSRFLEEYREKPIYIVSLLPNEMMKDIQAVNSVLCGTFKNFTHEANFWMSNGGTRSVIHYDADENFHCLLAGRKDFILIEKKYHHHLYMPRKEATAGSSYSPVDPDSVDLTKYPRIIDVPWYYTTLYAGDCVYIPARHIHQVRSYGRTISATTLFTRNVDRTFSNKGCDEFDNNKVYTMADVDFHWTYNSGDPTIDMGYINVEILRQRLLKLAEDFGGFNRTSFVEFFNDFAYDESMLNGDEVFDMFRKEFLTIEDVLNLKRSELKLICRAIDPPHGPVTTNDDVYYLPGEAPDTQDMIHDMDENTREKVFRKSANNDGVFHGSLGEDVNKLIERNEL